MADVGAPVAVTSLAALAFMARGHTPGQGPYGDNLNHAIDYILASQKSDGSLCTAPDRHTMYEHGIATVMLCEAYGMLDDARQKRAKDVIAKALRLIITAQNTAQGQHLGGWRYTPNSGDADISVTGWQLMALRGGANIGANIPKKAIDNGIIYINSRAAAAGGFSYSDGHVNSALTGTGVVALELLGQHHAKPAISGGDYLLAHSFDSRNLENPWYFYTVYYVSQAAWQLGGRYWDALNPVIRKSLLSHQTPNGSWSVNNSAEQGASPAYGTSMAILALTVPYRYLPIYQR